MRCEHRKVSIWLSGGSIYTLSGGYTFGDLGDGGAAAAGSGLD